MAHIRCMKCILTAFSLLFLYRALAVLPEAIQNDKVEVYLFSAISSSQGIIGIIGVLKEHFTTLILYKLFLVSTLIVRVVFPSKYINYMSFRIYRRKHKEQDGFSAVSLTLLIMDILCSDLLVNYAKAIRKRDAEIANERDNPTVVIM